MILALDFDGVIWDSVGECYHMARRAYGREAPECEQAFRSGRWLARAGGDFLLVLELAMEDPAADLSAYSKSAFAERAAREAAAMQAFSVEFYRQRDRVRVQEPEAWLAMQRPYPAVIEELPSLQARFQELVLCTTKDEASARQLLRSVGLDDLPIWGREHGLDKGEQVRDLCAQRGVECTQVAFVDDLLDNLEQVEPTGARLFLADWGYNTAAEREEARRRGIPVVSARGLAEQLCNA